MVLFIVLAIGLIAAVASIAASRVTRARGTPSDLKGDWWAEFEKQFRAYAARQATSERRLEN